MHRLVDSFLVIFLLLAPFVYFLFLAHSFKDEIKKSIPVLVSLFLLTAVFFNKLLLFTLSLAQQDFNNIQIPYWHFFSQSLRQFKAPIWNSTFCGGFDNFATPLAGYFSMFNWLFLLGDSVYKSINLFLFVQVFLCAYFAYLMLRTFSFSKIAAFLGGILFTFNGFVTMRLSPGVGVEYLFAYKWLPLIIAFSEKVLNEKRSRDLIGLAIVLAFSLEGNPSMAVANGVLWGLFLLFRYRELIANKFKIFLAPVLSLGIYSLKIIPTLEFFTKSEDRFMGSTGGWRQANFDLYMYPEVFLPIKPEFTNGIFTPGVVGLILFCVGVVGALFVWRKTKKAPFKGFSFVLITFVLAFLLTIENPVYYFFYSLPVLNKITIIPPFLIFYIFPIVFFGAFGISWLQKKFKVPWFLLILFPLAVFTEVLLGPSTFGGDTYSFNFAKMDYAKEPFGFPHYNVLRQQEGGPFFILQKPRLFLYPYAISLSGLQTLNSPNYYFGCTLDSRLTDSGAAEIREKALYVLSMYPLEDPELEFIDVVSLNPMLDHKSHAVFENRMAYFKLYATGWNDDIYIYKNLKDPTKLPAQDDYINPRVYIGFAVTLGVFGFIVFWWVRKFRGYYKRHGGRR